MSEDPQDRPLQDRPLQDRPLQDRPAQKVDNVASLAEARAAAASKKPASSFAADTDDAEDGHNPWAVALGAAVILGLLIGTWLLIDSMKCNPMFSDAGLYHSRACR
jgi:hypothetical protein